MKSTFDRLGDYISEIDNRNKEMFVTNLLGVSISKEFMPSVANVIGTDLSNYKIIRKNQFACSLMQVSRDGGIAVSLYKDENPSIMSPAYHLFEIVSTKLIPEYLEMIMISPEFDRAAVFYAVGGVRGTLTWEEFCDMRIPIPPIEEQRKIVHDYKVITDRIELLKKINENLEEQIISIFKKQFPNIHEGTNKLSDYCECVLGGTPSREDDSYWNGNISWINSGMVNEFRITNASEYITDEGLKHSSTKMMPMHTVVLAITGATLGQESITLIECCANQSVVGILENEEMPYQFIHPLIICSMQELLKKQTGGAQSHICKDDVGDILFGKPDKNDIDTFVNNAKDIYCLIETNCKEINTLIELSKNIIVSI